MKNFTGTTQLPLTENQRIALSTLYVVTITVATLGNVFVIRIVTKHKRLKTSTNVMIVQLAIADLLVAFLVMPRVLADLLGGYPFWLSGTVGKATCKTVEFLSHITIASSIVTLVLMAVERFFVVMHPLKRISFFRSKKAVTATIWVSSIVAMSPVLAAADIVPVSHGNFICTRQWRVFGNPLYLVRAFYITVFVLLYAFPLLLMAVLYSMISYKLWFRQQPGSALSCNEKLAETEKCQIVRMLMAIVIVFTLCWFPVHINHYAASYPMQEFNESFPTWLIYVNYWICHANSAFNPCLYITFHNKFRRAFVGLFQRKNTFDSSVYPSRRTSMNSWRSHSSRRASHQAIPYSTAVNLLKRDVQVSLRVTSSTCPSPSTCI